MHENSYCVDVGSLFESCQPSTHMVLDLGSTHATMEGVGVVASLSVLAHHTLHPTKVVKFDVSTHVSWRSHIPQGQCRKQTDKLLKKCWV